MPNTPHSSQPPDGPRFGLFLFDCAESGKVRQAEIEKVVARVPETADAWIDEVVVVLDRPAAETPPAAPIALAGRALALRYHHPPRDVGPGAARKAAFEYARLRGFDFAIVMRDDESHPPELLARLIDEVVGGERCLLLATRTGAPTGSARLGASLQNHTLGMRIADWGASYRVYPLDALQRIPYQLNANDGSFDAEILLQFRALGVPIRELPLLEGAPGDGRGNDGLPDTVGAWRAAVAYRCHQAHVTRDGRFLVDHDIHYTLKLSPTGSHMQIVSAIAPGSRVLDLGCSQGLLARPLQEKQVRVTGVDVGPGQHLAGELAEYHQHDLEKPLELPLEREFDYVVCADVIEHLRNRGPLLRSARRYLKPDGRLIISTPNIALWFYRLSLLVGRFEYGPRGVLDETHVHLFTGSTFRREVERAGFQVVRQRVTALPFEVVFESTGRSRLVRAIASAYHALARLWPSLFAYQFVLEAEITTLDEEATRSGGAAAEDA